MEVKQYQELFLLKKIHWIDEKTSTKLHYKFSWPLMVQAIKQQPSHANKIWLNRLELWKLDSTVQWTLKGSTGFLLLIFQVQLFFKIVDAHINKCKTFCVEGKNFGTNQHFWKHLFSCYFYNPLIYFYWEKISRCGI